MPYIVSKTNLQVNSVFFFCGLTAQRVKKADDFSPAFPFLAGIIHDDRRLV
jgi:hypothetical protein